MIKKSINKLVSQKSCLVIMPFRGPFDSYYEQIIKPAVFKAKMKCLRADEIYSVSPIMNDVLTRIHSADIIIAELTTRNQNVLYELGIAHAIGKPALMLSQTMDDIPSDLRHWRILLYDTIALNWAQELGKSIEKSLKEIESLGHFSVKPDREIIFFALQGVDELQTGFLQYWSFFVDYIKTTKRIVFDFKVTRLKDGLELEVKLTDEVKKDEVKKYLKEYYSYLLQKDINCEESFTYEVMNNEVELLNLQLREQKSNLERHIDILATKNRILENNKLDLFTLLQSSLNKPIQLSLNQSNEQTQIQSQKTEMSTKIHIDLEVRNNFSQLINVVKENKVFEDVEYKGVEKIIPELATVNGEDLAPKKKKTVTTFLRKLIDKIKDSKALLIDMPTVTKTIAGILASLLAFVSSLGTDALELVEQLRRTIEFLKYIA